MQQYVQTEDLPLVKYNVNIYVEPLGGFISSNCAEISFINTGQATVVINNSMLLLPSASLSINGNYGELDVSIYNVTFINPTNALQACTIIRKYYV